MALRKLEITIRDLQKKGTDTVILIGGVAEAFLLSKNQGDFLAKLETVEFEDPYIVEIKET